MLVIQYISVSEYELKLFSGWVSLSVVVVVMRSG